MAVCVPEFNCRKWNETAEDMLAFILLVGRREPPRHKMLVVTLRESRTGVYGPEIVVIFPQFFPSFEYGMTVCFNSTIKSAVTAASLLTRTHTSFAAYVE